MQSRIGSTFLASLRFDNATTVANDLGARSRFAADEILATDRGRIPQISYASRAKGNGVC